MRLRVDVDTFVTPFIKTRKLSAKKSLKAHVKKGK